MKIAIDAMGGDYAPAEIVAGALKWAAEHPVPLILVGDEARLREEIDACGGAPPALEIVHAAQIVGMNESASAALMGKKDSSITVATKLVKDGQADALVSCGNTGAQMAAALFVLGRMEGVERPPAIAGMPNLKGQSTYVIDVGANVDCKPVHLVQFAALGRVYARLMGGAENPRVALLNNGAEEKKGNAVAAEAHQLLKAQPALNFVGNIEGRDLFAGEAEVVVCDGFTGNILLKTMEGMALFMAALLARENAAPPRFMDAFNYNKVGGAPLLGVNGLSIVCHGSSKREAVYSGIGVAMTCLEKQLISRQREALAALTTSSAV